MSGYIYRRFETPAGRLRRRITVQESVRTDDGLGGFTLTWGGIGHEWPTWSEKGYVSGGDTTELQQTQPRLRFSYRIRSRKDVTFTSAMRVIDGALTCAITAVANDDADRSSQVLHCIEEAP